MTPNERARAADTGLPEGRGPSPVMLKFREWQESHAAAAQAALASLPEEEQDALDLRQISIEDDLMALPAEDARDVAAKVIALTSNGRASLDGCPDFWREMRSLVGMDAQPTEAAPLTDAARKPTRYKSGRRDAEGLAIQIGALSRIGMAACDHGLKMDLLPDFVALFETIDGLADDLAQGRAA